MLSLQSNIQQTVYFPIEIILNLILSFFLGLFISYIYKITHKGMSYLAVILYDNKYFISLIVCMVIMIIGNSLARAFALVGALSIIRFRTVVKDTKDTAYIFLGISKWTCVWYRKFQHSYYWKYYHCPVAYALHKPIMDLFIVVNLYCNLDMERPHLKIATYQKYLDTNCSSSTLLNLEIAGDKNSLKLTFDIILKEDITMNNFISWIVKIRKCK